VPSDRTITAQGLPSTDAFGGATILISPPQILGALSLDGSGGFGENASISNGNIVLQAIGKPSDEAFGQHALHPAGAVLTGGSVPHEDSFGHHFLLLGPPGLFAKGFDGSNPGNNFGHHEIGSNYWTSGSHVIDSDD
jgi:hypothetical protein